MSQQPVTTGTVQKVMGAMICLFAVIRLVSHPAGQNRVIDYVLLAIMFSCGVFLLLAKKPPPSGKQ